MSVACFWGFLGASERVLDDADRILARASRTRAWRAEGGGPGPGGRWRSLTVPCPIAHDIGAQAPPHPLH